MNATDRDVRSLIREALDRPFSFTEPKQAVPAEVRPQWRLPALLMILDKCRGRRATWQQLHVMNWAIRNEETRATFSALLAGELAPERVIVRYEPSLSGVVDLAAGLGYATWTNGRLLELTERGTAAIEQVQGHEALTVESDWLSTIPGAITQQTISAAVEGRGQ